MKQYMTLKKRFAVAALALFTGALAVGQSVNDHANLKANNARTGVNGNPATSTPGYLSTSARVSGVDRPSALRWWYPFINFARETQLELNQVSPYTTTIDDTDLGLATNLDASGNNVGPYEPLANGFASQTGAWFAPNETQEAFNPFRIPVRWNNNPNNTSPFDAVNFSDRHPSHHWAFTVPQSSSTTDPRVPDPALPTNFRAYTWTFSPRQSTFDTLSGEWVVTPDATIKNYAISVYIPEGPMVSPSGQTVFRQRYHVYEIVYGTGRRFVDVVDTWATGSGWVRLGNGGAPTNQVFPYAGLDGVGNPYPLQVRLLNTMPRNADGTFREPLRDGETSTGFAVVADAVRFDDKSTIGSQVASPTSAGFGTPNIRVTASTNFTQIDPTVATNDFRAPGTFEIGEVASLTYNFGTSNWTYRPNAAGGESRQFDNTSAAITSANFTVETTIPTRIGADYLQSTVTGATSTGQVTVNPDDALANGSYEIFTFLSGDESGVNHATEVTYEIYEGATLAETVRVNQATARGWVRLGTRRFVHEREEPSIPGSGNRLRVVMLNSSSVVGDVGRVVRADAFRFDESAGNAVNSTPVHVTALVRPSSGAAPVDTNVVLILDERGRIHCVDAEGRTDGTTRVYWTYPSIRTTASDPNLNVGLDPTDPTGQVFDGQDGALGAELPLEFDLSTAIVKRIDEVDAVGNPIQRDVLYVGARNGRIYAIDMTGRGDFDDVNRVPGTTFRRWTYPATYYRPDITSSTRTDEATNLGSIASVTQGTITVSGNPVDVIYAATEQGRVYCLDAKGNFAYTGTPELITTVRWAYPPTDRPNLAPIIAAPTLDETGNRFFFGTLDDGSRAGEFHCINATTGAYIWRYPPAPGGWTPTVNEPTPPAVNKSSFNVFAFAGGPAYVPETELSSTDFGIQPGTMPDTVFVHNSNHFVYAFDAATGGIQWQTDELQSGSAASLIYGRVTAQNQTGALINYPMVMAPTASGRFVGLFARTWDTNRSGGKRGWEDGTGIPAANTASMTLSNRWLYGASESGFLYAWSDVANGGGFAPPGFFPPNDETVVENDSAGDVFRGAEMALISRVGFENLRRQGTDGIRGVINLGDVVDLSGTYTRPNGRILGAYRSGRPDNVTPAYEWGETMYILIYNFPYLNQNPSGRQVVPPRARVQHSTPGRTTVASSGQAKCWADRAPGDADSGYVVVAIPLTSAGATSVPPGDGFLTAQLDSAALTNTLRNQTITLDPNLARIPYRVANPLGVRMYRYNPATAKFEPTTVDQFGVTTNATDPETQNGNYTVGPKVGENVRTDTLRLGHGQSGRTGIDVFDRSLMTLLRGENRGLENVRIARRDLQWLGGTSTIFRPFSTLGALFNGFEDAPTNFPNNSLDYPDIRREQVRVRKDPNGNAQDPILTRVDLTPPRGPGNTPVTPANAPDRVLRGTPFQFQVDVPRYQPFNTGIARTDSGGNNPLFNPGYEGRFSVLVEQDGNVRQRAGVNTAAFREFNLGSSLGPDQRLVVTTPTLDLGSLPMGFGYGPGVISNPGINYQRTLGPTSAFNPYGGYATTGFRTFQVLNEGNVNLLNVRLAKGTADATGTIFPWQFFSPTNEDTGYVSGLTDLWSDIDDVFAPRLNGNPVPIVLQKPRVGDVQGRQLRVKPRPRVNPNIAPSVLSPLWAGNGWNTSTGFLTSEFERDPRVGVSVPLGTPVGKYSQTLRVIEDSINLTGNPAGDQLLSLAVNANGSLDGLEAYSDPGFRLDFTVREAKLTGMAPRANNTNPGLTAENFVDNLPFFAGAGNLTGYNNLQPTGMHLPNGDLWMAWSSDREAPRVNTVRAPGQRLAHNIWLTRLAAGAPRTAGDTTSDLIRFRWNDANNWSTEPLQVTNLPVATMFGPTLRVNGQTIGQRPGTVDPFTVRYGYPSFPNRGSENGLLNAGAVDTNRTYLAFVGSAFRNDGGARTVDSRVFIAEFNVAAGVLTSSPTRIVSLDYDTFSIKSKPTVTLLPNGAMVTYTGLSNNQQTTYLARFDASTGQFAEPVPLTFGSGFASVTSPSIVARFAPNGPFAQGPNTVVYDVMFSGQLRDRRAGGLFFGRIEAAPNGDPFVPATRPRTWPWTPFADVYERPVFSAQNGNYSLRGAGLVGVTNPALFRVERVVGGIATPIVDPTTARIERDTGLVSMQTTLGGRLILDSSAGSFRIVGGNVPSATDLRVFYSANFIRVTDSEVAGYSSTNLMFDNRLARANFSNGSATFPDAFWFSNQNTILAPGTQEIASRYIVGGVRSGLGGGTTTRPFFMTLRYGVRLGFPLATNSDGALLDSVTVTTQTGNPINGAYQVDPAAGRIYFTLNDENTPVRISVNRVSVGTNVVINARPTLVGERSEEPVVLERAINESDVSMFFDPTVLDLAYSGRRSLIWMLWSSTRNGAPDIYMQTISPKLRPIIPNP